MSTRPNIRPITSLLRERGFTLVKRIYSSGASRQDYEHHGVFVVVWGGHDIGSQANSLTTPDGLVIDFHTAQELSEIFDANPVFKKTPRSRLERVTGLTGSERRRLIYRVRDGRCNEQDRVAAALLLERLLERETRRPISKEK